ncbi:hypothetical protein [Herbiconiux sp.]|uniref:hypothetical protein n=1 Tax=Herbiconiux sp. TaxID=1871186 RepID=UPI0025BCF4CC|nr:hypothetical protein [Herbiconiux sp.]
MLEPSRELSDDESALLSKLLEGDWNGAREARDQLLTARRTTFATGDLDFDLEVDSGLLPIPAPDGILEPTDQLVYRDGVCVAGVMIWISRGRLSSVEYYLLSELDYDRLPLAVEVRRDAGV